MMKVGLGEQNYFLGSSRKGKIFPQLRLVWEKSKIAFLRNY